MEVDKMKAYLDEVQRMSDQDRRDACVTKWTATYCDEIM